MDLYHVILALGLLVGGILALRGLFRPFLGLAIFMFIHFIQPGELVPALGVLHIERVYGILLFLAFLLYRNTCSTNSLFSNRVITASFVLIAAGCLTIPLAVWKTGALVGTFGLAINVIFLIMIAGLVDTKDRLRKMMWVLVGLLVWFSASGFISFFRGNISFQEGLDRAEGVNSIVGSPNALAGLVLALLPFLVPLLKFSRGILVRCFLLSCAGLGLATLVLSGARTSMIALVILAIYYALRSRHKVAVLFMSVLVAVVTWLAMPESYRMRYLTVAHYAEGGKLDASNQFRLQVWRAGIQMFVDHPILGVGTGQFSTAYGLFYKTRLHGAWMNPHNLLLQVACDLGIVGLIVFTYFLVQLIKELRATIRMKDAPGCEFVYEVAVACQAMLIGLVFLSATGHTLYRPYWYLLGGLVVACRFIANEIVAAERKAGDLNADGDVQNQFELQVSQT